MIDFEFEFILYSFQFGDSSGRDVVFVVIGVDFRYGQPVVEYGSEEWVGIEEVLCNNLVSPVVFLVKSGDKFLCSHSSIVFFVRES